ncbi:MAG: STAS domain-containing protein [Actinomycetota bacterium]|nr:STAS domain-containing protein [Actinomycetota bacterium]
MPDESRQETPGRRTQPRCSIAVALDRRHQGVVIVRASGEIDSAGAPKLSAALHRELDSGKCRLLVVDLRAVDFLGAQGIVVLDNARQHAQAYHIGFLLIANQAIQRLLQTLGMVKNFEFCDNIDYT